MKNKLFKKISFYSTKLLAVVLGLTMLMGIGPKGTLAYLTDNKGPIVNTFELDNITYQLTLAPNLPVTSSTVTMPSQPAGTTEVSDNSYKASVAAGHYDFGIDKDPSLEGYLFDGWYTGADSSAALLYPVGTDNISVGYNDPAPVVTSGGEVSLTVYAKWTPITYTIKYVANGPAEFISGTTADSTHTYDEAKNLTANGYSRTGYTFAGWNTKADGSGTAYTDEQSVINLTSTNNDVITLYAQWTANDVNYVVKHWQQNLGAAATQNSTNYTEVTADRQTLTAKADSEVTPAVKTYTGFTSPTAQTVTVAADGSTVVNYYYTRNSYTVTLNKDAGVNTVTGAGTYQYGASVTINATVKDGYTWSKWTGEHNVTNQSYSFTMPAKNVTDTATTTENIYNITYTLNGGTLPSGKTNPDTYKVTTPTFTLNNPTRTGYTFAGWSGTGLSGSANKTVTVAKGSTGDRAYTANWTANDVNYKVQHWQQTLTGANTPQNSTNYTLVTADTQTLTAKADSKVTPAVKSYTGFTSPSAQTVTVAADGSTVVNYYYTRNSYTVTVNKGTGISAVTGGGTYRYGASVTIDATVSTGYTWSKWTGEHNVTNQSYSFTMPAKNVTDTANATINTYPVTYNANGGSGAPGGQTKTYGQDLKLSSTQPTRTGYTFTGWNTAANGSGTKYASGATYTGNAALTLYAQWTPVTYKISYTLNGGSVSGNPSTYTIETATFTLKNPTRTGYTFTGWSGTGLSGSANKTVTVAKGSTGDRAYTANWTANDVNYKVEHYQQNVTGSGYTLKETETKTEKADSKVTPAVKTYTGFKSPATQTVTVAADGSTVVNYYYTRNSYTVTVNKGTGISAVTGGGTYRYGASVTIDATVSTGYTWSKWTGTHSTTTKKYTFTMPANNVTDTANATPNTYKVVYHSNDIAGGDSETITDTVTYGKSYTIRGESTFSFGNNLLAGWSTSATCNGKPDDIPIPGARVATYLNKSCEQPVSNLTATNGGTIHLYAIWTPKNVEVWAPPSGVYPWGQGLGEQNYAPYECDNGMSSPSGYLWQEHPSSAQDGLQGYNNIRKDDLHAYPVGYNSIYRYATPGVIMDITYMKYFRFDIRMHEGTLDQLKQMTDGQIEFTSSGVADNSEISALWSTVWANSYYSNHNNATGDWTTVYVPLSIFTGNTDKSAINFIGLYWVGDTDINLYAYMCDPQFIMDRPSGAVKFDLDKPSDPEPIDFVFDISIDELNAFANDEPKAGTDFTMTFAPAEGYAMPENIKVIIDGNEYLYPSADLSKGTDVEDRECYILTIPDYMLAAGGSLYIEALAQQLEGNITEDEENTIALNLDLLNVKAVSDTALTANTDYNMVLVPEDGYVMPEIIFVDIDGTEYEVYTDGIDYREHPEDDTVLPEIPVYNMENDTLTIPASLLTESTESVTVIAYGMECVDIPDIWLPMRLAPSAELTPEPTAEPTPRPTVEPTPAPTAEPTPEPTAEPTPRPTVEPSPAPTAEPTPEPTAEPTPRPTVEPTLAPTVEPTTEPTAEPTLRPTVEPTPAPTAEPTAEPTPRPTVEPSPAPQPSPIVPEEGGNDNEE